MGWPECMCQTSKAITLLTEGVTERRFMHDNGTCTTTVTNHPSLEHRDFHTNEMGWVHVLQCKKAMLQHMMKE